VADKCIGFTLHKEWFQYFRLKYDNMFKPQTTRQSLAHHRTINLLLWSCTNNYTYNHHNIILHNNQNYPQLKNYTIHHKRTNSWISLKNCTRSHLSIYCNPIPNPTILNRRNSQSNNNTKTVGNQWNCSYEYSDFTKLEFDSYIVQQEDHQINTFRLLDKGNRNVLPINSPIRLIVTAADMLHSWTVPRLGVKTDAISGRLNQVRFSINRPGLLYGQCSEIRAANHRSMQIVIERISTNQFINWISKIRESSYDWKQVMIS